MVVSTYNFNFNYNEVASQDKSVISYSEAFEVNNCKQDFRNLQFQQEKDALCPQGLVFQGA